MNDRTRTRAATVVAAVLAGDAMVHVYWMTGSTWPARDATSLSQAVLNVTVPFTPVGLLVPFTLLVTGATLLLAATGRLPRLADRLPGAVTRLGARALVAGLFARSAAGLVWASGLGTSPHAPFFWLNLLVYTPACLALFAAAVVATGPYRSAGPTALRPNPGR